MEWNVSSYDELREGDFSPTEESVVIADLDGGDVEGEGSGVTPHQAMVHVLTGAELRLGEICTRRVGGGMGTHQG